MRLCGRARLFILFFLDERQHSVRDGPFNPEAGEITAFFCILQHQLTELDGPLAFII